ncbi:glycoside hydrolase/deacetylase [Neocallimastix lanati (nom. inval.)]|uniref:Glycoside hydrolase/deacetylase n=1 Tax=Neocallimastix californiae TaxID=1754190 RepID=A0A1Y2F8J7_9FUNG|nr:glycoside hydrolase/deacetylase [Neocallimastix sp. JGI-2020a]ORY79235.1 glycoside hydrolase/deacetylase [Neocallimastix californiae]|eukprot:ORY79235.1 glycoside hydrolase/deacetylase [Neocallimastix californiae]
MKMFNYIKLFILVALSSLVHSEFIYSCTEDKTIALTFDDGPHRYTKKLVDYLVDQGDIKVTFFHVGRFHYPFAIDVQEFQDAMKKAHDNGFQIASHTYEHKISEDPIEFKKALHTMDDFINKVTGDRPRYFRAPKGHCKEKCLKQLDEWDYRVIQWDTDTNDWDYETSGSIEQRIEDSINYLKKEFAKEKKSYLILMHDSLNHTVNTIAPWIIEKSGMKEKGYRFVTVAECLGDKTSMYRSRKSYSDSDDNNTSKKISQDENKIDITKDNRSNDNIKNNSTTKDIFTPNDTSTTKDTSTPKVTTEFQYDNEDNYNSLNSGVLTKLKSISFLFYFIVSLTIYLLFSF